MTQLQTNITCTTQQNRIWSLPVHETVHMSILLNNWKITDKEEEVISYAEEQANKIIDKLGFNSKEQPKKGFFKK